MDISKASLLLVRDDILIVFFKPGSIPTPGQTTPEITCTRFYCKLCPGEMLHTTKVISVTGNDRQYLHTRLPNITSEATFHPEMCTVVLEYRVRFIEATQLKQVLFQCRDCKELIAHHWRSFAIPSCNNFEKDCSNSSQVHSITIIWLHQIHFKSTRHHQASGASSAALGASPTSLLHFDAELSIMTCIAGQRVSWYSLVCILVHSHAI